MQIGFHSDPQPANRSRRPPQHGASPANDYLRQEKVAKITRLGPLLPTILSLRLTLFGAQAVDVGSMSNSASMRLTVANATGEIAAAFFPRQRCRPARRTVALRAPTHCGRNRSLVLDIAMATAAGRIALGDL